MTAPRHCSSFTLDYHLTGSGWAECNVVADGVTQSVTASYLSDALGQLAAAALILRLGAPLARVSFDEEPGEYRWGFDWHRMPNGDVTSLRVRIWRFDDLWSYRPDEQGKVLLDVVVEASVVYKAVLHMLDGVLRKYGLDGYKEKWDSYAFPQAVHQELARLVNE